MPVAWVRRGLSLNLVRILQGEIGWDVRLNAVLCFAKSVQSDLSFSPSLMFWWEKKSSTDLTIRVFATFYLSAVVTHICREKPFPFTICVTKQAFVFPRGGYPIT